MREAGFYWVRLQGAEPVVARWFKYEGSYSDGKTWTKYWWDYPGSDDSPDEDAGLVVLSDRLIPPE